MKQIVGGTLSENPATLRTNFISEKPSSWFAELYRRDGLTGGHVIMLGPGNEQAALDALHAFPGGLQLGGGINPANGTRYLDAGASHVIVTSWVFHNATLDWGRLTELVDRIGRDRLVLDLSCRVRAGRYYVVTDHWQKFTTFEISEANLALLSKSCAEFLVHAVDVEGLAAGVDMPLVQHLAKISSIPVTYAGGATSLVDLERVTIHGGGKIDLTIGSALDIFGGKGVRYEDLVTFNRRLRTGRS